MSVLRSRGGAPRRVGSREPSGWLLLPLGLTLLFAVGAPPSGPAATLDGVVVDPQDRLVAGAAVSLSCGPVTREGRTGEHGGFRFDRPEGFGRCTITAAAAGFAPSGAQPARETQGLLVRLRLPVLAESLTVRPRRDEVGLSAYRSLSSASIGGPELRAVSDDTGELIRYARALAGTASSAETRLYVDGLLARTLPPADTIARIVVDADPFSAEHGDGSEARIDIATLASDRRLHVRLGGNPLGTGGRNALDPRATSRSRSWNIGLTGPVPHLPLTFSLHSSLASDRRDLPIRAIAPGGIEPPPTATVSGSSGSVLLALDYSRGEDTRARVSLFGSGGEQSGAGLSGISLPETGMSMRSDSRELRATFTTRSGGLVHRGGFVGSWLDSAMVANDLGPGVTVSGAWIGGGADAAALDVHGSSWFLKYVVGSGSGRLWRAGLAVSRSSDAELQVSNPSGRVVFETEQAYADAQAGLATGTWLGARGAGHTAFSSTVVSPFVEVEIHRSERLRLRGGLRADHQEGGGTLLSPRLSGVTRWHGSTLRWGGGLFVHNWSTGVLLQAIKNDRSHLDRFLARGDSGAVPIDSRLAGNLTRPRDLVLRASIERPFGDVTPGIEYTWTRSTHRLGSRRQALGAGWMDTLESNRFARRLQLHASLRWDGKGRSITAHYRWTRARDDTDGPFSFPEFPEDLAAEAARSTAVAPHELSVVASLSLPAGVSLRVVESYHSSTPYNITTGTDSAGNGLYNSRDGRPRNSGDGPDYHSTSLHCSHRLALPVPGGKAGQKIWANVGLHVENLLDNRNYTSFGAVAGSPLLGVPLAAHPGRSLRLTVSFDR